MGGNANFAKDWRLYALIDCLFCPAWPSSALFHFRNVLETIRATARVDLPALPPLLYTSPAQLKFERDSEGCTFLDAQPLVPAVVKTEPLPDEHHQLVNIEYKPTVTQLENAASHYLERATAESVIQRSPLTPANHILPEAEDAPYGGHTNGGQTDAERSASKRRRGRRSILPHSGKITMAIVEALRKENSLLEQQNDACLQSLVRKEKQFLDMKQNFLAYMERQEAVLALIKQTTIKLEP